MRCYYCGGETDFIEDLGNKRIPVCDKTQCRQEFYDDEEKRKDRNREYDEWRTRSE